MQIQYVSPDKTVPEDRMATEVNADIDRFADLIAQRRRGAVDEDDFRRFRLQRGIYGMRGQTDIQMIRVKIPQGILSAAQLERLGELVERFARRIGHVTTRQDVQLYWVPLEQVPQVLRLLAEVGLTTRESSGNVVRNVVACPLAGVCAGEEFNVTPYAAALSRHLLRNPLCQALPRKFKIGFSGCATDCIATGIQDLGALAVLHEEGGVIRRGFRLYVAGGLGPVPRAAHLLEPFTPAEDLVLTTVAILRVFDRLGNRRNKARARLKFLVEELGIDEVRRLILEERRVVWAAWSGEPTVVPELVEPTRTPDAGVYSPNGRQPDGFETWRKSNVAAQKQAGFFAAYVAVPGGDLTADQFQALATLLRRYPGTELRATSTQNVAFRWIKEGELPGLYTALDAAGLSRPGAHGISDVVSCPGADTCIQAVTYSQRLALGLTQQLAVMGQNAHLSDSLQGVTLKISGCPNSCGQYHIGTIGLCGGARRVGERQVPHYQVLLGGEVRNGAVTFGRPAIRIPARRVPEAIFRLVDTFRAERAAGESFLDWISSQEVGSGNGAIKQLLGDLTELPPYDEAPELYTDWGEEGEFKVQVGQGECAQ